MKFAKYYHLAKTDVYEKITYGWTQFLGAAFIALILIIFLQIWKSIYSGKPELEGFTLAQMMWYLAITEAVMFSSATDWIEKIGEEVKSGQLASSLLKPMDYAASKFVLNTANFVFKASVYLTLSLAMAYFLVGGIDLTLKGTAFSLFALLTGSLLNFTLVFILGLFALWFEDNTAFYWMYQKSIFILGGMLVPLDVYPVWLQNIVHYLPFGFMLYGPAKLFVHFSNELLMDTLMWQAIWLLPSLAILILMYKKGIREASINGG